MPRKATFDVDTHFEKNSDGVLVCKICKKEFKSVRKFNLKKHVEQIHKVVEEKKEIVQTPLKYKTKIIKCEISKKLLIKSYVGLVTEEAVSFNILNSTHMRNIIDPICKGIEKESGEKFCLNADNCKKALAEVAANVVKAISKECQNILISLKIDSASRLSRNIFGISAQYIYNDTIQSRILGMIELKGQHASTSKNLAIEILNVLNKYKINLQQIVSVTSDNGSNMLKSTKILSHCLKEEEDFDEEVLDNDAYFETINQMDNHTELRLGEISICRCAAHTAQLCALDATKDENIKQYVTNCRNLVKYLRKNSNGFKELFEIKSVKMPQLDCATRWGSTYLMVSALKNSKELLESVESLENVSSEESFVVNDDFWDFIESYCTVFSPLQKSIIKFQEEQLHYGDFYAQWLTLKLLTKKIMDDNNANNESFVYKISAVLLQSIEKRNTNLLSNNGLTACLYLDPRFQHLLSETQRMEAINYLKKLWEKHTSVSKEETNDISPNTQSIPTASAIPTTSENDEEDILNDFLNQEFFSNSINNTDVNSKIENLNLPYAKSCTNVLNFWKERKCSDPEIYALSNICFAIPPTQVSVERAFSTLKIVLTENRNRLNNDTLENILLVKLNPNFLDEAIAGLKLFGDTDSLE